MDDRELAEKLGATLWPYLTETLTKAFKDFFEKQAPGILEKELTRMRKGERKSA